MYLTQEEKGNLFAEHGKDKNDTGSAEGQIALFTRKDYATERSLVRLVGRRRSLLDYLMKKDIVRYREIVKKLNLRK